MYLCTHATGTWWASRRVSSTEWYSCKNTYLRRRFAVFPKSMQKIAFLCMIFREFFVLGRPLGVGTLPRQKVWRSRPPPMDWASRSALKSQNDSIYQRIFHPSKQVFINCLIPQIPITSRRSAPISAAQIRSQAYLLNPKPHQIRPYQDPLYRSSFKGIPSWARFRVYIVHRFSVT
jgi:hypothetical protein